MVSGMTGQRSPRASRAMQMKVSVAAANEKWFGDAGHGSPRSATPPTPAEQEKSQIAEENASFAKMVDMLQLVADSSVAARERRKQKLAIFSTSE